MVHVDFAPQSNSTSGNAMQVIEPLVIETGEHVDATVIWLHGLGADGYDFQDIVPALPLPEGPGIRFVFPHAPEIPVTANAGYVMRAWYDILEFSVERRINIEQLNASVGYLESLIKREISKGITSERIVIAGFSQGGAVAYQGALNFDQPLAGLLCMSTYIANQDALRFCAENASLPILIQHGQYDPVVPEQLADKARSLLAKHGYSSIYQHYATEHHLCQEQVLRIGEWLTQILSRGTPG